MGKISIIIPIYNSERTLKKCLNSLKRQTSKEFELILVNDGSTDSSLSICKKFKSQKKESTIIVDQLNKGLVEARRAGLNVVTSEYVLFVDADDWVSKYLVETLLSELEQPNLDVIVFNKYVCLGEGRLIKRKHKARDYFNGEKDIYTSYEIKKKLVPAYFHGHAFPASMHGKLYRKKILCENGNYLNRIKFLGEDLFYNLEILLNIEKLKIIDVPLYFYRKGGLSNKYMPYYFEDIINGYNIQKEVIDLYFTTTKEKHYRGITLVLLNMFKSGIYNLFSGNLLDTEIKSIIRKYASHPDVIAAMHTEIAAKLIDIDYLNALKNQDIDQLFDIGLTMMKKRRFKEFIMRTLEKIS